MSKPINQMTIEEIDAALLECANCFELVQQELMSANMAAENARMQITGLLMRQKDLSQTREAMGGLLVMQGGYIKPARG